VERPSQVPVGGVQQAHVANVRGRADRWASHTPGGWWR
jgi:hypothetical protein